MCLRLRRDSPQSEKGFHRKDAKDPEKTAESERSIDALVHGCWCEGVCQGLRTERNDLIEPVRQALAATTH
jgi:hypothetical protein